MQTLVIQYQIGTSSPSWYPLARIHPRINLVHCEYCAGTGKYKAVVVGQWRELQCTQCNGRGTICTDEGQS